jgi:hypothetical protein
MAFFTISTSSGSCYIDDPPLPKHGPLPIIPISAFDGYVSPSGGLISYGCFDIRGKNLSTNRKVRRYFEAQTEELACKLAEDSGMAGPFEVTVRLSRPAESWQLSELRIYNIIADPIPDGLSYWDARSLQERIDSGDSSPVSFDFARLAFQFGVKFSRCSCSSAILNASHFLSTDDYIKLLSIWRQST